MADRPSTFYRDPQFRELQRATRQRADQGDGVTPILIGTTTAMSHYDLARGLATDDQKQAANAYELRRDQMDLDGK